MFVYKWDPFASPENEGVGGLEFNNDGGAESVECANPENTGFPGVENTGSAAGALD